jgi:membrane-bound metal-dependent hydrolase YbcI (DUF457 family)
MPFTPLHMGPGLALKSVAGRHFSILMFGLTQVAIDIEPGIGMLRGADVLHGWTHTYLGATLIAALVLAIGRPLCALILRRWNRELRHHRLGWLAEADESVGWVPAAIGSFVGAWSHVALDSIMHADMRPFNPLDGSNALLAAISIESLHLVCVVAGLVGVALWIAARGWLRAKQRG